MHKNPRIMCDMLYISINTYLSLLLCLSSGLSSFIKEGWRLNRLLRLCLPFISVFSFFLHLSEQRFYAKSIDFLYGSICDDDVMTPDKGCSNQYLKIYKRENMKKFFFNKLWIDWFYITNGSASNEIKIWFWYGWFMIL